MVLYHLVASQYLYFGQWEHQTIHLLFLFFLTFLSFVPKTQKLPAKAVYIGCILLAVACCLYVYGNIEDLEATQGFPTQLSVVVGVCLILLAMFGTYLSWGLPLLLVALSFIGYFLWGHHLTGPLHHSEFSFDYIISYLSIGLSGMYGTFLSVSADQVFLFVVFGSVLAVFKVDGLLMELGKILGSRIRGGAGITAVLSNSLIGMVSGAPVANVAITSPFVLPYMRESGYTVDEAGGVIACSATGSQLMPPIMGAAAFMMATFIGQPYSVIMLAAILPAILFYVAVGVGVQFMAVSKDIKPVKLAIDWGLILRRLPVFVVPIGVIFIMLIMRYSPAMTAFWAIAVTLLVGFARKETRPSRKEFADALIQGAVTGAKIGISLVLIGTVAQTLISTGLGAKLASLIHYFAQNQLLLALALTMIVALILGCAVPPAAAYALCAIIIIPTLIPMGVELLNAHMYCFYFSIIAAVTPPVGLASLAATGISGGSYAKTSMHGFRLAISGFILPFMIVYNPLFTFQTDDLVWFLFSPVSIVVSLIALTALLYGAILRRMRLPEYLLCAAAVVVGTWHVFAGNTQGSFMGITAALASACLLGAAVFVQKMSLGGMAMPLREATS